MTPGQVWWLIEDMLPEPDLNREEEMAEAYKMLKAAKAKEANNG